jgi:NAD(P)-dependent dehydrogenase (short-subunit alcohol dehydrogenase family)
MGESVLITGAGRGLGLALTRAFLEKGFTVFALSSSRREALDALVKESEGRLHAYLCDVTQEEQIADAARKIAEKTDSLDILINNAAVFLEERDRDLDRIDFEAMKKTYDVNAVSPLRVIKHFIGLLLKGGRRQIVNISSEAGSVADSWRKSEYGYCMSKSALNMASSILQNRFREDGVKVLALHPGWVRTDMGGKEAPILPEESAKKLSALILKKWKPADPIYFDLDGKNMKW